jgi:hypothetical protein
MRLINPVTGLPVDAEGEAAELLKARGFKPEAKPRKAPARKPTPKKPKTTD